MLAGRICAGVRLNRNRILVCVRRFCAEKCTLYPKGSIFHTHFLCDNHGHVQLQSNREVSSVADKFSILGMFYVVTCGFWLGILNICIYVSYIQRLELCVSVMCMCYEARCDIHKCVCVCLSSCV